MKPLNLSLMAAAAVALGTESCDAFTTANLNLRPARGQQQQAHPSSSLPTTNTRASLSSRDPSRTSLYSTPFDGATPNDQVIREEYSKWRQKYGKGEFDSVRYENFKANFMAVTVRNNMERTRARQNGEAAPSPIALNEFGDCSADEYRTAMGQQQQQQYSGSGPRRVPASRPVNANQQGLQPANTIINNNTSTPSTTNNNNKARREADLRNASAQLRAAVQQRTSMEDELAQMKKLLEEKKKLLAKATKDEQDCNQRLALREEQKRLLNERLNNGWEDEGGMNGMNNNYY